MTYTLDFSDHSSLTQDETGGKGVNLSRLSQAGFPVPPGFCVSTVAYRAFLATDGLADRLAQLADTLSYNDTAALERQTAKIREVMLAAPMPEGISTEIAQSYARLGGETFVAVRSSGTAEDLADASFAGQHDTYLDVLGADEVIAAVRRCWASLWTARATGYRRQHNFDHTAVAIAVVVQKMVTSEVSGVMFTGNPLTTATDETVINATWGLGESLVQGAITPDQFVVQVPQYTVIEEEIGSKELRIVRDVAAGRGVVEENVPTDQRARATLRSQQIIDLARLGQSVQKYYGGFPQDIEWAIEAGTLYLLQSRPITGVDFTWDADVDLAHLQPVAVDTIWTRAYADAIMTGSPGALQYACRTPQFSNRHMRRMWEIFGFQDLAEMRAFKYWKGQWYFNIDTERLPIERLVPPPLRGMFLDFIPPTMHEQVLNAPFDWATFVRAMIRWHTLDPDTTPGQFPRTFEAWRARTDYEGKTNEELRNLNDDELIAYCQHITALEGEWGDYIFLPYFFTLRFAMAGLAWMLTKWYDDGDPMAAFATLVAGATRRTDTQRENSDLLELVTIIRRSPALSTALEEYDASGFFEHAHTFLEGRHFLERYHEWIAKWGSRGHADRDFLHPRRADDPSLDYRAFKLMLNADADHDPEAAERTLARKREETFQQVLANVATKPDGPLKVEVLKAVLPLCHEYLIIRDNERCRPTDVLMYAWKRGFDEIGRRLYERNMIDDPRDHNCLSEVELYQFFRGLEEQPDLLKAKITARRKHIDAALRKEATPPKYLVRNRPVDLDHPRLDGAEGVYTGTATSPGAYTGTARVVRDHSEMGRVRPGDILVTHSTDPGWNPVFTVIKAVVVETGGMLSHASCLAREIGFPAVYLPEAMQLIDDGATITVDGNTGSVIVEDGAEKVTEALGRDEVGASA
jgi:rifampicin phosphotransferase